MAIDPNIPLAIRPPQITLPDPNRQITLANLAMQMQDRQQTMQIRQQQFDQQNALRGILSAPGSIDASGNVTPEARQKIMAADPSAGMALQKSALAAQDAESRRALINSETFQKKVALTKDLNGRALATYEDAVKAGTPDAQARVIAQKAYTDGIADLSSSGLFSKDELQRVNPQFDPQRMRSNVMSYEQYQARQDKEKTDEEHARHDKVMEKQGQARIDYQQGITPDGQKGGIATAGTGASGADFLKTLPPQQQLQVKALAEGRMQFPSGFALRSPYWQRMLQEVAQYDPNFDAVNYNSRAKTRNDFTSGKSAQNITSFNTAIGHLGTLAEAADGLKNTSIPLLNTLQNTGESAVGDPRVTKFQLAANAVADELTRAFRGTGGNESDIQAWKKTLSSSNSPAQLKAAIKQGVSLLESRIEAVGQQYNRGMGTTSDPLNLLSKKAISTLRKLGIDVPKDINGGMLDPKASPEASGGSASPASSGAPNPAAGGVPVLTEAQYNAAPSGTRYRMPNDPPGKFRVKP